LLDSIPEEEFGVGYAIVLKSLVVGIDVCANELACASGRFFCEFETVEPSYKGQ
jgi:hypothetical protein